MSRLLKPFLVLIAVSFFVSVSYAAAKKPADKGRGGGGGGAKVTTEMCKITGEVSSAGPVAVGTNVGVYSPENITLTLSPTFAPGYAATYEGVARVLKRQGRLDFYFDHSGENTTCGPRLDDSSTNVCPDRLILLDGVYDRKADTIVISQPARVYLYLDFGTYEVFGGDGQDGRTLVQGESVTIDFEPYE